jgi:hypothetical protein
MPVCAYYSVNYNNWAYLEHPDWRLVPACSRNTSILHHERYGVVCLNNPDYRAFLRAQIAEIARYDIDACFFDMIWWNGVCTCVHCLGRCRKETGADLPRTVDWFAPEWLRSKLRGKGHRTRLRAARGSARRGPGPGLPQLRARARRLTRPCPQVGGLSRLPGRHFYGGREEQLVVSRSC